MKRTKTDRLERQDELEKRADRNPDEMDKPTVLIPMEQQIQQRAYELYEQRGKADGHDLEDWLEAKREIKGRQSNSATT